MLLANLLIHLLIIVRRYYWLGVLSMHHDTHALAYEAVDDYLLSV